MGIVCFNSKRMDFLTVSLYHIIRFIYWVTIPLTDKLQSLRQAPGVFQLSENKNRKWPEKSKRYDISNFDSTSMNLHWILIHKLGVHCWAKAHLVFQPAEMKHKGSSKFKWQGIAAVLSWFCIEFKSQSSNSSFKQKLIWFPNYLKGKQKIQLSYTYTSKTKVQWLEHWTSVPKDPGSTPGWYPMCRLLRQGSNLVCASVHPAV